MAAAKLSSADARVAVHDVQSAIRRRSVSVDARMRVADAIRALALDICGGDESLSAADRAWLRQAIAEPVTEATEEALRVLMKELTGALRGAPARVHPNIVAPPVKRTDFE